MKLLAIAVICAIASAVSAVAPQGGGQSGGQVDAQTGGQAAGNQKKPCVGRTDEECVEPECYKYISVTYDPKANAGERWKGISFFGISFKCCWFTNAQTLQATLSVKSQRYISDVGKSLLRCLYVVEKRLLGHVQYQIEIIDNLIHNFEILIYTTFCCLIYCC